MTVAYPPMIVIFDIRGVEDYKDKDKTASRILKYFLNIYNRKCLNVLVVIKQNTPQAGKLDLYDSLKNSYKKNINGYNLL